jgi:hypothetical protein
MIREGRAWCLAGKNKQTHAKKKKINYESKQECFQSCAAESVFLKMSVRLFQSARVVLLNVYAPDCSSSLSSSSSPPSSSSSTHCFLAQLSESANAGHGTPVKLHTAAYVVGAATHHQHSRTVKRHIMFLQK